MRDGQIDKASRPTPRRPQRPARPEHPHRADLDTTGQPRLDRARSAQQLQLPREQWLNDTLVAAALGLATVPLFGQLSDMITAASNTRAVTKPIANALF